MINDTGSKVTTQYSYMSEEGMVKGILLKIKTEKPGLLADFGDSIHLTKVNGRYVALIEAETISFEKGSSPVEFYKPEGLHEVIERIRNKTEQD